MAVRVIGLDELDHDLREVGERLDDARPVMEQIAASMTKFVHVRSGYLRSTIYSKNGIAGADAPYAGFEEERGGDHAFATRAIEAFNTERYADTVWEPLE